MAALPQLYVADILSDALYNNRKGGTVSFDNISDIIIVIANVIQIALAFAGILAIIFVVVAGLRYASSSGDPGKVKGAKDTLTNAITGLVVSSASYLIVEVLARNLGA